MTDDTLAWFEQALAGRRCRVERREYDWTFDFGDGCVVDVASPWRIVAQGRIVLTASDDGHQFGLPKPVDAEAEANKLLGGLEATAASVDRQTADLRIIFANGGRVDVFNNSLGYEGWTASFRSDKHPTRIIALGGGACKAC